MYEKFYVQGIAAKIYFLKNVKKTCKPNNRKTCTNFKRSDCGSSVHLKSFFKRSITEANELETYVNTYSFDLIFSFCSV